MSRARLVSGGVSLLELAGLGAVVYGTSRVSVTAAVILAGVLAVLAALSLERDRKAA